MRDAFATVVAAREAGVHLVQDAMGSGRTLLGFEVDDAVTGCIESRGLGEFIRHRTGHNIGREVHGAGANMDNYETHDERRIIPWTCFSIEPGLYFPEFGVRSEVDVFFDEHSARVTGAVQQEIATL
jgi:Xaa-Pro aminopeptidase